MRQWASGIHKLGLDITDCDFKLLTSCVEVAWLFLLGVGEDQGGVGVPDVQAHARLVVIRVGFAKVGIALGDGAVLGSSSAGNPAADGKTQGESGVEGGAIMRSSLKTSRRSDNV
jgi:hypothetical protein